MREAKRYRLPVSPKTPPTVVSLVVGEYAQADDIDAVTVNLEGDACAMSTADGFTSVWTWPSGSPTKSAHEGEHSASQLYSSLFQPSSSQHIFSLNTGTGTQCLAFAPDSGALLSGSSRGSVDLWSIEKERKLVSYIGHSSRTPVWDVSHAPTGLYFATSAGDSTARIWRTDIPYPIRCFKDDDSKHIHFVRWHPQTQIVAIASAERVSVRDVGTSQVLFQYDDCKGCTALEFSPSGHLLAAANEECLRVWETTTGKCIFTVDTFSTILSLAWTQPTGTGLDGGVKGPEGNSVGSGHSVLISVEQSGKVRMWDRLSISKPSVCEMNMTHPVRPLHMHCTPRNLIVVAGVRESPRIDQIGTSMGFGV
jgi:WD40 repeat protein